MGAVGAGGFAMQEIGADASPYVTGIKTFVKMFKTGEEPVSRKRMLKPVLVLEAMKRALKSGETEKVLK